jgi:hypothetical protein
MAISIDLGRRQQLPRHRHRVNCLGLSSSNAIMNRAVTEGVAGYVRALSAAGH